MGGAVRRPAPRFSLVATTLIALLIPATALGAQGPGDAIEPRHPTEPGAPFRPDPSRVDPVATRAEVLQALDAIELAEAALRGRDELGSTAQILASQRASYDRQLEDLEPVLATLSADRLPRPVRESRLDAAICLPGASVTVVSSLRSIEK